MASFETGRGIAFLRVAALASSVLLMLPGAWGNSVTVVEFAHLPAGLAAWQRHSLGIYRVCGPLSKFLYALPAHLAGVRVDYPESFDSDTRSRREWEVGRLFQSGNTKRYHNIYRWSRLMPIAMTILGGCLVCEWATRLFGTWPGLLSLCVWCWMPPILAHGSLVTSDMPSAVTMLLAARSFWSFLLRPRLLSALLAGLALGLAQATKFTLLVLYPCWTLLIIGRALQLRGGAIGARGQRFSCFRFIVFAVAVFIISVVVLDALYLFRDVGFHLAQWRDGSSSLALDVHRLGESRATAWLLQVPLPIPLEFLRGLDVQLADTERLQSAYLLGQTRIGGWWYWYVAASLIKVPLPALALFGLALVRWPAVSRGGGHILWASLCLLLPAMEAALAISSTTGTGTNAAFRYLVPSIALCCVWMGSVGNSRSSRVVPFAATALLGWLATNAAVGIPDHLGWQNELGWGWHRSTGKPALIGDSLDWGQDLARLREWMSRHSNEGNIIVCTCGFGDTEPYRLKPPWARPASDADGHTAYLAVSEAILFDEDNTNHVSVGGKSSFLTETQRGKVVKASPFDWAGRTIRIYRLHDL